MRPTRFSHLEHLKPSDEAIAKHYDRLRPNEDTWADPSFADLDLGEALNEIKNLATAGAELDASEGKLSRPTEANIQNESAKRVALALLVLSYGADSIIDRFGHPLS